MNNDFEKLDLHKFLHHVFRDEIQAEEKTGGIKFRIKIGYVSGFMENIQQSIK